MEANLSDQNEQSEEAHVSGRWIRDQLREVAGSSLAQLEASKAATEPVAEVTAAADEQATEEAPEAPDVVGDLAASISHAVAAPIRDMERRRAAEHAALQQAVGEHSEALETAVGDIQRLAEGLSDLRQEYEGRQVEQGRLAERVEKIEEAKVSEALTGLRERLDALQERIGEIAEEGRQRAEGMDRIAASQSRRTESMRHVGELLDRMREAVRMSESDTADQNDEAH